MTTEDKNAKDLIPSHFLAQEDKREMVHHPDHYQSDILCRNCNHPIECIDVIEGMPFLQGTIIKYLWRVGKKFNAVEDLKKSAWYLQRWIEILEKKSV